MLFAATVLLSVVLQAPSQISVFVTPDSRDGFVMVTPGIQDSIRDLNLKINKRKTLRAARTPELADLTLVVKERIDNAGEAGTVTVPIAGSLYSIPSTQRGVRVVLKVGAHEQEFLGVHEYWSECAEKIAKDIEAWVKANRAAIPTKGRQP